jgi:3-deoxy-7-phosphoheptulonate synthase
VPVLKEVSHLPVIADPQPWHRHQPPRPAMALASVGGRADGIMLEMHPNPREALSGRSAIAYACPNSKL